MLRTALTRSGVASTKSIRSEPVICVLKSGVDGWKVSKMSTSWMSGLEQRLHIRLEGLSESLKSPQSSIDSLFWRSSLRNVLRSLRKW